LLKKESFLNQTILGQRLKNIFKLNPTTFYAKVTLHLRFFSKWSGSAVSKEANLQPSIII